MRQFFRMLLLALVLMTVALVSALTAMRLAIHGREVAIPKLVGMSPLEAERAGAASGLQVNLPDVPLDQVISQSPPANASGVAAPKISLLVSAGPEPPTYVMPNLTGQPLGSAMLALQDAGIRVGKVSVLPPPLPGEPQTAPIAPSAVSEPSGASMIVTQTPAPGQKIVAGSAVNFEVR